jgi:hypothetical protein
MNYTLIAYKANSADYCRGCAMERFDSEHVILQTEEREELLNKWSDLLCQNMNRQRGEDTFDITILVNGSDLWCDDIPDVSYSDLTDAANALAAEKDAQFKHGVSLQKQADERARKARELAADRAELARLQAKLANT